MINLGWLGKSIVATLIFILLYLLVGIITRQYNMRPESFIAAYIIGAAVGIILWSIASGQTELLKPTIPMIIIFILGATLGALANIYLIQAVAGGSNPGIAATIIGSCGVFVYIIGTIMAVVLPKYFKRMAFDWIDLLSVLLIFSGIAIISLKEYLKGA